MKTFIYLCAFLLLCIFISCSEEESDNQGDIHKEIGILDWEGAYEVDGCGFFLYINNHQYKPENESIINNEFKNGENIVLVEYILLGYQIQSSCGDSPNSINTDGVKLISIKKQ